MRGALLLALAVAAYGVRINEESCGGGNGAKYCAQEFCKDKEEYGYGVYRFKGGADAFEACERCWDEACRYKGEEGKRYCLGDVFRNSCTRPTPKKTDRIAIIGAGVHGTFLGRRLKKNGYTNVRLFEKEAEVAGVTESFTADGKVFDYATKLIPTDRTEGPGMEPEIAQMLSEYGLTPKPYLSGTFYDSATKRVLPAPAVLLRYMATPQGQQLLVDNMIRGFEILKAAGKAGTTFGILKAGLVLKNETWADYSRRIQLPAFTDLAAWLTDGFLNGPANSLPAVTVLVARVYMMPPFVRTLLLQAGITANSTLPLSDELRAVLGNPVPATYYTIAEGYKSLFRSIREKEGLDVCLQCEVTQIKYRRCGVEVVAKVNGKKRREYFDHVVIGSRPLQTIDFLTKKTEARKLLDATVAEPVNVFMFRSESTPEELGSQFATWFYPAAHSFPADGSIIAVAKDYAESNVVGAMGYADPAATEEESIEKARGDLSSYGIPVGEMIGFRQYDYVVGPPISAVADGWFDKVEKQQGVLNTYLIGEALAGYGGPMALEYVNQFVKQYFHE